MIIKEDTPAILTTRPVPERDSLPITRLSHHHTLGSNSYPSTPNHSANHAPSSPSRDSSTSAYDSPPHYAPPSPRPSSSLLYPPNARLNGVDPAPWRGVPLPRYKSKKRPLRFVPLFLVVVVSGLLLGACTNFLVESIIKIATTHIRPQMFIVFRQILIPCHLLLAAAVCTLLLSPVHHLLPMPRPPRIPFRELNMHQQALRTLRMFIPILGMILNVIGGCWYLAVALQQAGPDENLTDQWVPLGNGIEVKMNPLYPNDGRFWNKWFFEDPNVKLVVFSASLSLAVSILYLMHSFPSTAVHQFFSGPDPPEKMRWLEARAMRWCDKIARRLSGDNGEGDEEEEDRWERDMAERELMMVERTLSSEDGMRRSREGTDGGVGRGRNEGSRGRRRFEGFGRSLTGRRRLQPGIIESGS